MPQQPRTDVLTSWCACVTFKTVHCDLILDYCGWLLLEGGVTPKLAFDGEHHPRAFLPISSLSGRKRNSARHGPCFAEFPIRYDGAIK